MTSALLAAFAYFLTLLGYFSAGVLFVEWGLHLLPGSGLNPLRRFFFSFSYPFLSIGDKTLAVEFRGFKSRGLLPAIGILILARFVIPWLVLASYAQRG